MTAAQYAISLGLAGGLKTMTETIKISRQTLRNWHYDRPEAFKALVLGVIEMTKGEVK